jgi:glycerol-3-phosphate dehydrogenase
MKDLGKIKTKINALYPSVAVSTERGCIVLEGELDNYSDIVNAGKLAVSKGSLGVINDIKLKGHNYAAKPDDVSDLSLEGYKCDVLIVGGGVVGCAIARELAKRDIKILLIEKEYDVALAASGRNDGMIHPGIDLHKGTQKLFYNRRGNVMFDKLCQELGVEFKRCGAYFFFSKTWEKYIVPILNSTAKKNGMYDYKYVPKKKLSGLNEHVPSWAEGAFFMGSTGIVSPYKLTIALAENAVQNGVKFSFKTKLTGMEVKDSQIVSAQTNRGTVYPKLVINAAGVFSDIVADMAGDRTFTIHPRKGTTFIADKMQSKNICNTAISRSLVADMVIGVINKLKGKGSNKSHTKGGGIMITADGNILVGPTAVETIDRENTDVDTADVKALLAKHSETAPSMQAKDIITYFTGVRASTYEEDFVVRKGMFTKNIIEVAGIQSPGLTCAPSIAEDIEKFVVEMLNSVGTQAKVKPNFNPVRKPIVNIASLSDEEKDAVIKQNPNYGVVVCRCEQVTKGEILDAVNNVLGVVSLDAVKKRVRPGMGRCQGGFCLPIVAKIIADELKIDMLDVKKGDAEILLMNNKEGAV